jgi:hypothetical protein
MVEAIAVALRLGTLAKPVTDVLLIMFSHHIRLLKVARCGGHCPVAQTLKVTPPVDKARSGMAGLETRREREIPETDSHVDVPWRESPSRPRRGASGA